MSHLDNFWPANSSEATLDSRLSSESLSSSKDNTTLSALAPPWKRAEASSNEKMFLDWCGWGRGLFRHSNEHLFLCTELNTYFKLTQMVRLTVDSNVERKWFDPIHYLQCFPVKITLSNFNSMAAHEKFGFLNEVAPQIGNSHQATRTLSWLEPN